MQSKAKQFAIERDRKGKGKGKSLCCISMLFAICNTGKWGRRGRGGKEERGV